MPFLEIIHYTGEVDRRELVKQTPLTIGSHSSNDIQVDEEEVEIMHCRISWGKKGFEAVAAGVEPLDVNGTAVQRAVLAAGDILRFGSIDIRYRDSEDDGADRGAVEDSEGGLGLKPLSEELPPAGAVVKSPAPGGDAPSRKKPRKPEPAEPQESWEMGRDPDAFAAALDALAAESKSEGGGSRAAGRRSRRSEPAAAAGAGAAAAAPLAASDPALAAQADALAEAEPIADAEPVSDGLSDRVRQALRSQQRRPGEEDPLRSPLVLALAGGACALLLTGAIFFFIATRQTTQQAFDAAKAYYDEGNFRSSIEAFQNFLVANPRHPLTAEAKQLLGLSRIRQHIDTASPRFEEGLKQLRAFIDEQKDLDGFELLHPELVTHSKKISLDAAVAAGRQYDPELLEISRQARTILKTYAPKDAPPTETLDQIEQALRVSEAAILRDDVYKQHLASIDEALKNDDPLQALKLRRDLLVRYPQFERDKKVVERMQNTLEAERQRVVATDVDVAAATEDHAWPLDVLTLAFQGRTRTDEVPVGQAVVAIAQDCCYGLELVTGQPVWRRVIGFDSPFFPLIASDSASVILFDTNFQELVCIGQHDGKFRWRQPLGTSIAGEPLLTSDAVYVPTSDNRLLAVDVASGQLTGQLQFSQPVTGPVLTDNEQQLIVAGDQEVVYTLTRRPFACEAVFDLGHPAGSIQAPLLSMASYLLLIENGNSRATLHLLKSVPEQPLTVAATGNVNGRVLDRPVIRGRDLFVPSSGERVSAFSLSDDPGQPPLTAGPVFQGEGALQNPAYLLTGPDRQLWMATGALARLRLTTDSIQPDSDPVASGLTTQPLQYLSGSLFHARRRPFTSAVTVTRTDRDELRSDWQAVLGGPILAWSSSPGGNLNIAAVKGAGQVFRIGTRQLSEGKFLTDSSSRLPLHQDLQEPLLASSVSNNRLAIACGGPEPRMWLVNAVGQIEGSPLLAAGPQAPPCPLGDDVLVPMAGRIHVSRPSGRSPVQDFALPTGENRTWVSVSPAADKQAIAVTAEGIVILLRLNDSPRPHLGEVARVDLAQPVKHAAAASENAFAVVDGSSRVSVFESQRLEPRGERQFPGGITNSPFVVGDRLLVEEQQERLHCLEQGGDLPILWSVELPGSGVAGVLQHQDQYIIALQNGAVLTVDPANGQIVSQTETLNRLARGPLATDAGLFVATVDGSLIKLP